MTDLSPKVTSCIYGLHLIYIRRRHAAPHRGERPLIQHVSARTGALGMRSLGAWFRSRPRPSGSIPGDLQHGTACLFDAQSKAERRKAPTCGVEQMASPGGDWVKKMIYHSSCPGLRQTQVHRSRAVAHPDPSCCRCQGPDACVEWSGRAEVGGSGCSPGQGDRWPLHRGTCTADGGRVAGPGWA